MKEKAYKLELSVEEYQLIYELRSYRRALEEFDTSRAELDIARKTFTEAREKILAACFWNR